MTLRILKRSTLNAIGIRAAAAALMISALACGNEPAAEVGEQDSNIHAATPPIYFNHTYCMLSQATIDALQTNAYLQQEFIDVELRTTVRPDLTYTGTYLNARDTYLEFFPEGTFGYPRGVVGLALGDETEGGVQQIQQKWNTEFGPDESALLAISRTINGVVVPWFQMADLDWANNSLYTGMWVMEYYPNEGSTTPRTRREERSLRYQPSKLAKNVDALLYGIPVEDRSNLRRALRSSGFRVVGNDDHFAAFSSRDAGTSRVILVEPSTPDRIGLLGVVFRLNRAEEHTEQLGDAVLQVSPGGLPMAFLWFAPPTSTQEVLLGQAIE